MDYLNKVLFGNCLEQLNKIPDCCLDAAVLDPPYGLGKEPTIEEIIAYLRGADLVTGDFMGKKWDIPSVPVWRELFRVLKPGAHVLSFAGTRTTDLLSIGLRAAGFENRDTIASEFGCPQLQWVTSQGMPKSHNVSKAIDKKAGTKRKVVGVKPGHEEFVARSTTGDTDYTGTGALNGFDRPWMHDEGARQNYHMLTAPESEDAKTWNGYGTGLKPAWENILCFRKPLDFRGIVDTIGSCLFELYVNFVKPLSSLSPPGLSGVSDSVPLSVGPQSATRGDSLDLMAMWQSVWATYIPSSTVSSWLLIWDEVLDAANTCTIATESSLITELRTLNSFLLKIMPGNTPKKWMNPIGLQWLVSNVGLSFDAVSQKLRLILTPSAQEIVTEKDPGDYQGKVVPTPPQFEPILVFRKPLEGTVAENVVKYGTGAINIDATRVKHSDPKDFEKHKAMVDRLKEKGGSLGDSWKNTSDLSGANEVQEAGRWPGNVLYTHSPECRRAGTKKVKAASMPIVSPTPFGSFNDDGWKPQPAAHPGFGDAEGKEEVETWYCVETCPVRILDEQSGDRPSTLTGRADPEAAHTNPGDNGGASWFGGGNSKVYADGGGASRFFKQFEGQELPEASFKYMPKASKKDRDGWAGEKTFYRSKSDLTPEVLTKIAAVIDPTQLHEKVPTSLQKYFDEVGVKGKPINGHPTVKPVELMRYLVRLVTPKGGIVIDPYCGSGSTLHAAVLEGMNFVGIERWDYAYQIARKRMEVVCQEADERKHEQEMFALATGG